ncbi:MAG: hypothetical protein M1825_001597, partial [Sarcosagium campestre]
MPGTHDWVPAELEHLSKIWIVVSDSYAELARLMNEAFPDQLFTWDDILNGLQKALEA